MEGVAYKAQFTKLTLKNKVLFLNKRHNNVMMGTRAK